MEGLSMCISTQTPLVQFLRSDADRSTPTPGASVDLTDLKEGVDYRYTPGGVTRMVFPLLKRMLRDGLLATADWVSLNPAGPSLVNAESIRCHHVSLEGERLASYGKVKEVIWGAVHGTGGQTAAAEDMFWTEDFPEYAYYNRRCAELIGELDRERDFDVFYIHDFQQLPLGRMLGTLKPKIYRWHIPFEGSVIPGKWEEPLAAYLNSYDVVIVSSASYHDALKGFGYTGSIRKVYPYVDPDAYTKPTKEDVAATSRKLGLRPRDQVALVVARMDPMKGQDRAILALASLAPRHPNLKLVLVGNGSFSGSKQGVGLPKSAMWRGKLEALAARLGIEDRVVFAGHLGQRDLDAVYARSAMTILPSLNEGFGLVVVEGWIHHRPPVVSRRAGVAELVEDGTNGLLFDPDDPDTLPERMERLLNDRELARKIGRRGFVTSKRCSLETGLHAETEVIGQLVGG
jgi:glycosyltransferase involved in cell wall biosynthesis